MDTEPRPTDHDAESDPYFRIADVGPGKGPAQAVGRGRGIYLRRLSGLGAMLAVVWMGVLLDPRVGPLVLLVLAAFAAVIGVFVGAMGLGLLGFGLCAAGDRFIGWLRQGSRWPEE